MEAPVATEPAPCAVETCGACANPISEAGVVQLPAAVAVLPSAMGATEKEERDNRHATLLRPRKLPANSRYESLLLERQKTLGSRDLWGQVTLPPGASEEEWLAVTTIDFFNELNLLTGALSDICTEASCPIMCAGPYTFAWADGEKIKVPTKMSAPRYFEHLLTWVEKQLADESLLPVQPGVAFPPHYRKGMRVIYKRLFRIYAHTFHSHFKDLVDGEADAHLNHSFKHFIYFVKEFNLVDEEELEPMKDLIALLVGQRARESFKEGAEY
mmetsp:Transcript_41263/g.106770  ORF Transcript_41263/g.106770 Transcript_41263/m.106770 type:complete len:271 (+) Transcript_41263:104-916(+)